MRAPAGRAGALCSCGAQGRRRSPPGGFPRCRRRTIHQPNGWLLVTREPAAVQVGRPPWSRTAWLAFRIRGVENRPVLVVLADDATVRVRRAVTVIMDPYDRFGPGVPDGARRLRPGADTPERRRKWHARLESDLGDLAPGSVRRWPGGARFGGAGG